MPTHSEIYTASATFLSLCSFFRLLFLIYFSFNCPKCGRTMKLSKTRSLNIIQKWKCFVKTCQTRRSVLFGSFFFYQKVSFFQNLCLIFYYFYQINIMNTSRMLKLDRHTVGRFFKHIRDSVITMEDHNLTTRKIGGILRLLKWMRPTMEMITKFLEVSVLRMVIFY